MIATLIVSLPLLVVLFRSLAAGWRPSSGDIATIEIRVRDVGTSYQPLLGSYGRYGFNHPGPLWFVVLALPYRLFGNLETPVLLVGIASVAVIMWVADRRGGLWFAAALTAVLVWAAGPLQLSSAWEPYGLLLPTAALLFLTFDTVSGRAWSFPLVVGFASVLAAAQATLLPFAVAMTVVAFVSVRSRRAALAAIGTGLVLWLPTLVQQVTSHPGNLSAMWAARSSPEPSLGLVDAWRAVAIELGHRPSWAGFSLPLQGLSATVNLHAAPLVPIGFVALVAALCYRRHPFGLVALAAIAAGVIGMSQLLGPVFIWIPDWLRVLGFGAWLAAGWAVIDRIPRWSCLCVLGVFSLLAVTASATFEHPPDYVGDAVRTLSAEVHDLPEPVLVTSQANVPLVFGGGDIGVEIIVLDLERRGIETVVDASEANRFGSKRAEPERAASVVCLRTVESGGIDPLPAPLRSERNHILDQLGLPPHAGPADILALAAKDPSARGLARRLLELPDLPRLELLHEPCPVSGPSSDQAPSTP